MPVHVLGVKCEICGNVATIVVAAFETDEPLINVYNICEHVHVYAATNDDNTTSGGKEP